MPPPRILAFVLAILAGLALAVPVAYTWTRWDSFGPNGRLVATGVLVVALFGIVTVLLSVGRAILHRGENL